MAEEINIVINADVKDATKDTKKLGSTVKETSESAKDSALNFKVMGVSINNVRKGIAKVGVLSKRAFATMKSAIASTGIGLLLVAFASLQAYFKSSEKGASELAKRTNSLKAAFDNVLDVVQDFGRAVSKLVKGDWKGFTEALEDAWHSLKNVGDITRADIKAVHDLEDAIFNLSQQERDNVVARAENQKKISELRFKARDEENFNHKQRLQFIREANKLSEEQLEEDLKIAKERLRIQQEQNKIKGDLQKEDKDKTSQLAADILNIENRNFLELKRLKMEEVTLFNQVEAEKKAAQDKELERLKKLREEREEANKEQLSQAKDFFGKFFELTNQAAVLQIEDEQEKADKLLGIQKETDMEAINDMKITDEQKAALRKLLVDKYRLLEEQNAENDEKLNEARVENEIKAFGQLAGALGSLAGESKELAIAQGIIDTYLGVNKAFAQGGTLGFVTGAAILVQGLANVKKIMEQDVGTGSGGGTSSPSDFQSRFLASDSQISSGAFTLGGGLEPEPARAFVVSDDITDSQNKLANIRRRATI